jgi:hypothetical protein
VDHIEGHCQEKIGEQDQNVAGYNACCGGSSNSSGAAACIHAPIAANSNDDYAEDNGFDEAGGHIE